jgi:hypothetical protein
MGDIIMDNFIEHDGWFDTNYELFLRGRYPSFRIALNLLFLLPYHNIVETGSVCRLNDTGSGYSTYIFGDFLAHYGGHLTTIDLDPAVTDACRVITKRFEKNITCVTGNSLDVLKSLTKPVDLLYLDSMDVPEDGDATPGQEHALREFKTVEHLLHGKSIVLLDDNRMTNGGKTQLLKQYLREREWRELFDSHQSLWIR